MNAESLYVSQVFTVHQNIIDFFNKSDVDEFKISDVRNFLLATTMRNKSNDNVRMFVSKQLNAMVKQELLTTNGNLRNKVFRKTRRFEEFKIKGNDEQERNEFQTQIAIKPDSYLSELSKIKKKLNGELAILIAEMDEYRSIMTNFPQTQKKVRRLYEESTQRSATITGQITALTKTIELIQSEAS